MRSLALTLTAGLLLAAGARAQQPPAPPPAADPKLDPLLARWEKETANIRTILADITCTRKNPLFNKIDVLTGKARLLRQDDGTYLVSVELNHKENPERDEKYLCTGTHLYVFRPQEKLIYVYPLPPRKAGQPADKGFMPFMIGMKAEVAKQRYQLRVAQENEWYTYVTVIPNYPEDQAEFIFARLAILNKETQMIPKDTPKEIFWVEPNKVEVKWDITRIQRDVPGTVSRDDFLPPDPRKLPAGWNFKYERPLNAPPPEPRVIRPQQSGN
jgi:TIGR03009 family protein